MDLENTVIKLCVLGTQAEFQNRQADARVLYNQAWKIAQDDFEHCVAAHYVARFQDEPTEKLRWNLLALDHANAVKDSSVADFYPSLYLNIGQSYELIGKLSEASMYYKLASDLGAIHRLGEEEKR